MVESAWQTGRYEECLDKARRIVADYPQAAVWHNRKAHERVAGCLDKLGKPREARAFYEEWEKKDPDGHYRQKWCFMAADCCLAEKDRTAALAAYHRVISGHCDDNTSDLWYAAQDKAVDLLADSGDYRAALQEAHVAFDASPVALISSNITRIVNLLSKLDKNGARAERFIAFQKYGPDGPDGKPGTADALTNPLDEIGYPADPDRKQCWPRPLPGRAATRRRRTIAA